MLDPRLDLIRQFVAYQGRAVEWEDGPLQVDSHHIKSVVLMLPYDFGPSQLPRMQTDMCFLRHIW